MAVQLLFCVETDKKSNTDWVYIHDTIKKYYVQTNKIKLQPIYMGSKNKYNSPKILKEINGWIKKYNGNTVVMMCIDTDDYNNQQYYKNEFTKIQSYCQNKGFELIWFCRDIEHVFIGKRIEKKQKVDEAFRFRRNNLISNVNTTNLFSDSIRDKRSNILLVLDKHLTRKA